MMRRVLAIVVFAAAGSSAAGQLVLPTLPHQSWNLIPFGAASNGSGPGRSVQHQVYRADLFGTSPVHISGIAFAAWNHISVTGPVHSLGELRIRLGYTTRAPGVGAGAGGLDVPNSAGGGAPNAIPGTMVDFYLESAQVVDITAGGPGSFDEMEFTGTPFAFDPSLGNLLVEIIVDQSSNTAMAVSHAVGSSESSKSYSTVRFGNATQATATRMRFTLASTGACCLPTGACISGVTSAQCAAAYGQFRGAGTDCSVPCVGACCLPSGDCTTTTPHRCAVLGGSFRGAGTGCETACTPRAMLIKLGTLGGATLSDGVAISSDGTMIAGNSGGRVFRWTRVGETQEGVMEDLGAGSAAAISDDGTIVGTSENRATRWLGPSAIPFGPPESSATGIDWSGTTIVGSWVPPRGACIGPGPYPAFTAPCHITSKAVCEYLNRIYKGDGTNCDTCCPDYVHHWWHPIDNYPVSKLCTWTWSGELSELPQDPFSTTYGRAIAGMGGFVAGSRISGTTWMAFRATIGAGSTQTSVPGLPGATRTFPFAMSGDGAVIVGESNYQAIRWTLTGGTQALGFLPGGAFSRATATSSDGSVVVGFSERKVGNTSITRPFLWTEALGMVDLVFYLSAQGVDTIGLGSSTVHGISADGSAVVGTANFQGQTRAFLAILPIKSPAGATDSDGDGLLDQWEKEGIPIQGSETERYPLPGADPLHKDLYVEVDSMPGFFLGELAKVALENAFRYSPVRNPDGTNGIRLHLQRDEANTNIRYEWDLSGEGLTADFDSYRNAYFGTPEERTNSARRDAKAKAYRYCVLADRSKPQKVYGIAELGGDNLIVFAGALNERWPGDSMQVAATFMHELGHTLGLDHGGCDPINAKPNYPSIMNYMLGHPYEWNYPFWRLDYSRAGPAEGLRNLFEGHLNETMGVGPSLNGYYNGWELPFAVTVNSGGSLSRGFARRPNGRLYGIRLDGRPVDLGDPTGTGLQDGLYQNGIVQDLNYIGSLWPETMFPSGGQTLVAFNDWANIHLGPRGTRGPNAPEVTIPDELTVEQVDAIEQAVPVTSVCAPDFNGDGQLTPLDMQQFQAAFVSQDPRADFNRDFTITGHDVAAFHQAYNAGCP